jgi:hypothetical protein
LAADLNVNNKLKSLLKKKEFILTEDDYGPIINLYKDNAYNFLIKLYEFLTG